MLADTGYLLDPHTAVGVAIGRSLRGGREPVVTLATAHPAKFPDAVEKATGTRPRLPARLGDLLERTERADGLRNDVEAMFAAEGITIQPKIVVDSLEFACRLVGLGAGVAIADPLTPAALGAGRLAMVPWRPRTLFHVGVLLPALMPPSPSVERFLDCLRGEARRLGGRPAPA